VKQLDLALLVMRVSFGVGLAAHGYNKVFGGGGLKGTAGWFGSIGMKWPKWQARLAAGTELGAGLLFALGLLTPFAGAGLIGLMMVAIVTVHWTVGFFVFRPNQGWEYCAAITVVGFAVSTIGAGKYSLDHALHIDRHITGWSGALIAGILGVGGALLHLAVSYRPPAKAAAEPAAK
jgi:putative oxidoreductase